MSSFLYKFLSLPIQGATTLPSKLASNNELSFILLKLSLNVSPRTYCKSILSLAISVMGMTPIKCILTTENVLRVIVQKVKDTVSKLMIRTSDDREITKTPIIFALEKNLNENLIKVLVAGAKTQDIVDLVLYSKSVVPICSYEDSNPSKKRRLH